MVQEAILLKLFCSVTVSHCYTANKVFYGTGVYIVFPLKKMIKYSFPEQFQE